MTLVTNDAYRKMYIRTLYFAIAMAIAAVVILWVVLKVPGASEWSTFFVISELGVVVIIISVLYRIQRHKRRANNRAQNLESMQLPVTSCPDYFSMKHDAQTGAVVCKNEFTDGKNVKTSFLASRAGAPAVPDTISLDAYEKLNALETCTLVDPTSDAQGLYNVPWTSLRGRCRSLQNTEM